MTKEYDYLSDRTVEGQQEYLNDFIAKINTNVDNGTIEVKGKDISNENERTLTTDTHGDLMSMMGAAVMCGVKFKENEFLYYDRNEGIYYEKVDGKFYEYIPPYIGEKKQGKPVDKIAEDNSITVVPIPDTSNARELYHLGDVLDRGQESLTSLLLCEVCPNIKLAQGNHEFSDSMNKYYGYKKEIPSINLALARMKHNGRINTVYYDGKGDDVISYSHIPLTEDHVIGFFNFLSSVYITSKYSKINPPPIKYLNKEFEKQEECGDLFCKIKGFLNKNKNLIKNNKLDFKTIKNDFTKEEMLIIKNVVSGALIERQFEVGEDGKITFVNGGFNKIYNDFDELEKGEIINSDRDCESTAICYSVMGHTPAKNEITIKGNNKCLDIDDMKSAGFEKKGENNGKSCATVTNINIETGIANHSSFNVKREEKGKVAIDSYGRILKMQRKNNNITNNFQKNESGHDIQTLNFKLPTEIIKYLSENFIKNIANEDDFIIFQFFDFAIRYGSANIVDKLFNNEKLKDKLSKNINIEKLTFNALDNGNINMAKVLIKHGFKFNTKKLTKERGKFETFENTLIALAEKYNIKKENFKKINFSLVGQNVFKYKAIEESEFKRLNNVLDLIKEQIEIENNSQIQKY